MSVVELQSETVRCRFQRPGSQDLPVVAEVLREAGDALQSGLLTRSVEALADEVVHNSVLPPGGQKERARTFLILDKAEAVPMGFIEYYCGFPNQESLYISRLFLRAEWQGKGFGSEVIAELERQALLTGKEEVRLSVNVPNWSALWFWVKSGYNSITGVFGPAAAPDGRVELRKSIASRADL